MKPYVAALVLAVAVPAVRPSAPDEGMTRENALARYGLPEEIVVGPDHMTYVYAGREGGSFGVTFHEDLSVTRLATEELGPLVPVPRSGPHLGQAAGDLIEELGPAVSCTSSAGGLVLDFGGGHRVQVARGVVVGVEGP